MKYYYHQKASRIKQNLKKKRIRILSFLKEIRKIKKNVRIEKFGKISQNFSEIFICQRDNFTFCILEFD